MADMTEKSNKQRLFDFDYVDEEWFAASLQNLKQFVCWGCPCGCEHNFSSDCPVNVDEIINNAINIGKKRKVQEIIKWMDEKKKEERMCQNEQ